MIYDLKSSNFKDFKVYAVNKLPYRSYFIPFPDKDSADRASR